MVLANETAQEQQGVAMDSVTRGVAEQLLALSEDSDSQIAMAAQDGVMSGLIAYLEHKDPHVVRLSAKAIRNLSSNPKNRKSLVSNKQLRETLVRVKGHSDPLVKQSLTETIRNLRSQSSRSKSQSVLNIRMRIVGIDDDHMRKEVEAVLVRIRGVVSFTLDKYTSEAVVRVKGSADKVVAELRERLAELEAGAREQKPIYEDETEYLDDDNSIYGPAGYGTMSRRGYSTLDEMLEAKRKEKSAKEGAGGIGGMFSKIGSTVSSGFGWW